MFYLQVVRATGWIGLLQLTRAAVVYMHAVQLSISAANRDYRKQNSSCIPDCVVGSPDITTMEMKIKMLT